MGVLIDASSLIEAERGRLDVLPFVEVQGNEEFFISVVTASELLHGVHRAKDPDQGARRSAFVEAVLERFAMLEIDSVIARAHARISAELAASGTVIRPHDLWLAASCIAHGLTIVTSNVREFERISGLDVEVWASVGV